MRICSCAALLFGLLSLAPAWADTVYLTNGRKFENVVAETTETEVTIRMPGGLLSLSRSQVLRVESSESTFSEYLRRKEAIHRSGSASDAAAWLLLAQWAKIQGLEQGAREAALTAAHLNPRLEGLAALLRSHGFVLDEGLDRWIPYAESMRRRGFVQAEGQWISREENEARQRAREEELARRRAERAATQAAEATQAVREVELALANMQLQDRLQQTAQPAVVDWPVYYAYPGYWLAPPAPCRHCGVRPNPPGNNPRPEPPQGQGPRPRQPRSQGVFHVPGSLLPGNLGASTSAHSSRK